MSRQVQIDYQQIGIQCQCTCEVAEARLKEFEDLLLKLQETSGSIIDERALELKKMIEQEKNNLINQINDVRMKAQKDAELGIVTLDDQDNRYMHRNDAVLAAQNLQRTADIMASEKLIEFRSLLTVLLGESISENYRKMRERGRGVITLDSETQSVLDGIADSTLRQFTYIAYLRDNTLAKEKLIEAGKALMDKSLNETYESRLAEEEAKIRAELEEARVERQIVGKVMGATGSAKEKLVAIRQAATQEIVGEKIRQKTLKVIIEAIKKRGFIVDKKNIKIQRDTNEVVAVGLKASGETAKFRVFTDGKFIYDFHGYEGQACLKDIDPFMHDLEDVYGIKVVSRTEIWSNPDKISTMKYQAVNTNKNKK